MTATIYDYDLYCHEPRWTAQEMLAEFDVIQFLTPFVVVRRKLDAMIGSLAFRHGVYFDWQAHPPRIKYGWA